MELHIQPAKTTENKKTRYRWIPLTQRIPFRLPPPRPFVPPPPPPPPMYDVDVQATVFKPKDFNGEPVQYEADYGELDYGYDDTKNDRGGGNLDGEAYAGYGSLEYEK